MTLEHADRVLIEQRDYLARVAQTAADRDARVLQKAACALETHRIEAHGRAEDAVDSGIATWTRQSAITAVARILGEQERGDDREQVAARILARLEAVYGFKATGP